MEASLVLFLFSLLLPTCVLWCRQLASLTTDHIALAEADIQACQGMAFMRREIHDGKRFSLAEGGKALQFLNGNNEWITYRCNLQGQVLRQVNGTGASLLAHHVKALCFSLQEGGRGVVIKMETQVGRVDRSWQCFAAARSD